jgi:hypothetical protein
METSGLDFFFAVHRSLHAPPPSGGGTFFSTICAGLTEAQYRQRPDGHNSIAFSLWHISRWEDMIVNTALHAEPEVLDRDGWLLRLGIDKRDVGEGWAPEEVDDFSARVDISALYEYRAAVAHQTLAGLTPADLTNLEEPVPGAAERILASGGLDPRAERERARLPQRPRRYLVAYVVLGHSFQHLEQINHIAELLGRRSNE